RDPDGGGPGAIAVRLPNAYEVVVLFPVRETGVDESGFDRRAALHVALHDDAVFEEVEPLDERLAVERDSARFELDGRSGVRDLRTHRVAAALESNRQQVARRTLLAREKAARPQRLEDRFFRQLLGEHSGDAGLPLLAPFGAG